MQQQTQTTENKPTPAQNVAEELSSMHAELQRMVNDVRLKTKSASAEARHLVDVLDEEIKRFGGEVVNAAADTRDDLEKTGNDLRMRLQKLANQVALPS